MRYECEASRHPEMDDRPGYYLFTLVELPIGHTVLHGEAPDRPFVESVCEAYAEAAQVQDLEFVWREA